MDDQAPPTDPPKPKRIPPSRKGKGPTATSFKPGVSGNPKGRTPMRHGLAFAERVRERVSPDLVIDLAMRVAENEKMDPAARLAALWPLIDRGFIKPPTSITATIETSSAPQLDWSRLPVAERMELLKRLRAPQLEAAVDDGPKKNDATEFFSDPSEP